MRLIALSSSEEMEFYLKLSGNWEEVHNSSSYCHYRWRHNGGALVSTLMAYDMELHKEYYEDTPYYT